MPRPVPFAALLLCGLCIAASARAALSPSEEGVLGRLDAARAIGDMRRLSASADGVEQGVGEGSVVAGSPEEAALAADIAARFRALGLEVRSESFPVRKYRYSVPRLRVDGKDLAAIALHATGAVSGVRDGVPFRLGNEADGTRLRVPLVDAGEGYAADYARTASVQGKAVLVHRDLRDWPPAQISEAAHRGAAAIVFWDHAASGDHVDALRQDSLWGHEQLPTVAISVASARALRERLAAGALEMRLESRVEIGDGHSQNVLGVMRGSELPEQSVLVSAHYDRWFRGGLDNVSGTAAVLELARVFSEAGLRPRRTLVFMAAGSEEAGLEDPERDWLAGSNAFLQAHPEVFRQAALVVNIDGIGWKAAEGQLGVTPDLAAKQQQVLDDLGVTAISLKLSTVSAVDAWNYGVLAGAATAHLFSMDPGYFAIYHTQEDVVAPERFTNLQRDLRLTALGLYRAATAARYAPSLTALADQVRGQFDAEAKRMAGVSFAPVLAALAEFRAAAAAIEAPGSGEPDGVQADRLLMATRHALVPWLYVADGEFSQAIRTAEYANRVQAIDGALAALRGGDRAAALGALAAVYEGRQCQRLSPAVYAFERAFWAGEGGWSSRFGHRAPPPLPAFDAACRALAGGTTQSGAISAGLQAARTEALQAIETQLALVSAKLRHAAWLLQPALAKRAAE